MTIKQLGEDVTRLQADIKMQEALYREGIHSNKTFEELKYLRVKIRRLKSDIERAVDMQNFLQTDSHSSSVT